METGGLPMDFTDGIEKLRANMSAEYDRAYDTLCKVTIVLLEVLVS